MHGSEELVYGDDPREAADSTCVAIISGRIASGVPWLLHSILVLIQLPYQSHYNAGIDVVA